MDTLYFNCGTLEARVSQVNQPDESVGNAAQRRVIALAGIHSGRSRGRRYCPIRTRSVAPVGTSSLDTRHLIKKQNDFPRNCSTTRFSNCNFIGIRLKRSGSSLGRASNQSLLHRK